MSFFYARGPSDIFAHAFVIRRCISHSLLTGGVDGAGMGLNRPPAPGWYLGTLGESSNRMPRFRGGVPNSPPPAAAGAVGSSVHRCTEGRNTDHGLEMGVLSLKASGVGCRAGAAGTGV